MKSHKTKNRQRRAGMYLLVSLITGILLSYIIFPFSIQLNIDSRLETSSYRHPLGTDSLGRDYLSCLIYGTGISVGIGVVVVVISAFAGTLLGMVSGMTGGIIDILIMRAVDILLAFPGLLLAAVALAFFRAGVWTLIFLLAIATWASYARIVRAEVLKYKQKEFILAARGYNASTVRIIFHHMMPLVCPLVMLQAALDIPAVILAQAGLNFLGIGLSPEIPTLGQLIDSGMEYIFLHPHLIIYPGIILFLIVISFSLISESFSLQSPH